MNRSRTRRIYLVRHGAVDFHDGISRCIGRTEVPLSALGRKQAEMLAQYFKRHSVTCVFASPLGRCQETAKILSGGRYPVKTEEGLCELDMGEWENVPQQELRERRGKTLESEPEHGESRQAGLKRFGQAIERALRYSKGDIVCVAHAGVNCCYLSKYLGEPLDTSRALPQPYGCLSIIEAEENGRKRVVRCGVMPEKAPDVEACQRMWEHYHTPEAVISHCKAVSVKALEIGRMLNQTGCDLNLDVIQSAALLHDIARNRPHHAEEGARILRREGYPELAEMIRRHHDLVREDEEWNANAQPDETEVVYLADKLTQETKTVTLAERFADSRKRCEARCDSQEALAAHKRRREEAEQVEQKIKMHIHSNRVLKS